jgi:IS30 family transposase
MPEHFGGHLTFEDRCEIARMLAERQSFAVIARAVGVSPSTITREIRRARIDAGYPHARQQACKHYRDCKLGGKCGSESCKQYCKGCRHFVCSPGSCMFFAEDLCPKVTSSPLCCNGCAKRARCALRQFFYRAKEAQQFSEQLLKESRSQITLSPEELKALTLKVKELLALGQSTAHIWRTHRDEFAISERTFY